MATTKKVILFIVEGTSDQSALALLMEQFFSAHQVRFHVVHGDVTSEVGVSYDNVTKRVLEIIKSFLKKYPYKQNDILRIIHLVDTDGAFVDEHCILQADVQRVQYFEDKILAQNPKSIINRNKRKTDALSRLSTTSQIYKSPYSVYYNSCNLEHVLYNSIREFSDEEKNDLADDFSLKYENKIDEFIDFISDETFAVRGKYKETWTYIMTGYNSLQRHTNMHLIFADERNNGNL